MIDGQKRVFVTALADNRSSDVEGLGAIRQEGSKRYKWVKFSGTNAVAVGDALCYVVTDTNCETVDKANSAIPAGVSACAAAAGVVSYGWIQVRGLCTLASAFGGAVAVGSGVSNVGAAAGVLQLIAAATSEWVGTVIHVANKITLLKYPE